MSDEQRAIIVQLLEAIRNELQHEDGHTNQIIVSYIGLILEYVSRFYAQQLSTSSTMTNDLLQRFENLLKRYYADGEYLRQGLPSVKYCAQNLFLSPNYFGDLIKQLTGDTASNAIRRFVMQRARSLLISGSSISETAEQLGFDYPQHFTRMFKKYYQVPPSAYKKNN